VRFMSPPAIRVTATALEAGSPNCGRTSLRMNSPSSVSDSTSPQFWRRRHAGQVLMAARSPSSPPAVAARARSLRYHGTMEADNLEASLADDHDPLVEALLRDVDMSLLRRNLRLTPQERLEQLGEMQRFAAALAEAGRRARQRG